MTEQALPEPPTPSPAASGHMRLEDVSGLFMWVSAQIAGTEGRITASIEKQAKEADRRWGEFERALGLIEQRVEKLEDRDERADTIRAARMGPFRSSASWVGDHYRDIAFLAIAILTALGIINGTAA
jgi:hypothetical protein